MRRFRNFVAITLFLSLCSPLGAQSQPSPLELFLRAAGHETGEGGTGKDMGAAVRLYEQAALQGHTPSMVRLGFLLREGLGVERDLPGSFALFTRAAEGGDPNGQFLLAVSHELGIGTRKDLFQARKWFLTAAGAGNQLAQYKLGLVLLQGKGGPKKEAAARRWLDRAASGSDRVVAAKAGEIRDKVDQRLFSPDNSGTELLAAAAALLVVGVLASPDNGGGATTSGGPGGTNDFGPGAWPSSQQRHCYPVPVSSSGMIVNDSALSRPGSYSAVKMVCD